jgi:hypothetical protein
MLIILLRLILSAAQHCCVVRVDHVARFAKADELVAVLQIAATQVAGLEDVVAAAGAAQTVVMPACLSLSLIPPMDPVLVG